MSVLRRRTLIWTDMRIRKMKEVLASIKLIKMYAWEEAFKTSIMDIRTREAKPLIRSSIFNLIFNAIMPITPSLATVVTIALFANAGNELTVSKRFMLEDEFIPPSRDVECSMNAIELRDTVFMWDSNASTTPDDGEKMSLVLRHETITIRKGKHIGICGTVGCGKSSLLQAVIGRMPLISGHIAVDGTVAYAAQQAWIFNGTLRENILFGQPYKQDWYTKVLHACSLEPDLRTLANGDMTEIGDRGVNLSGGQKQRVSLARAVYNNSDIYLLDDPLSAVDGHVGQHLFHKCIDSVLRNKTVVLVTHQLQYLKHCDEIYVMVDGEIVQHGTHETLLAEEGNYSKLIGSLDTTCDKDDYSSDDGDSIDLGPDDTRITTRSKHEDPTCSCDDKYMKGVLTDRETSKIGEISMETYMSYVRAAGGKLVLVFVLVLYVCSLSSVAFTEWWLGIWIRQRNAQEQVTVPFGFTDTRTNLSDMENFTKHPLQTINLTTSLEVEEELEKTDWYLTVYIYSTLGIIGLAILKGVMAGIVMIRASKTLHNNAVRRVMSAPMQFFDANPPGRIINRFSRDIEDADIFIPHTLDILLQGIIMCAISLVTTAYNFPLFLIAVVAIVFYFYIIKTIASVPVRNFKRLENVARSPLLSHMTTSCSGLSTIVSYSQQDFFMKGCQQYSDMTSVGMLLFDSSMRWMSLRMDIGGSVLAVITTIIVVSTKDAVSPALAALSLTMCINMTSLIQFFSRTITEVEATFTSIERIHEYEKIQVEKETETLQVDSKWPSQGRIVFSNVEMKYRTDMDPVLKNISFDILPRQKVGIVGRTGAGKSSLAAALFRLTDLSGGHVIIDGVEIGNISRKRLRSKLASIPQDPVLFAGTLRYNLDPFHKQTDEEIWTALDQVHLKEMMNPIYLDLTIEENGENFSVGERQLICLARAILRQNKILVLDEATASIDTSTDALIQETVRDCFSDCTVLTIAHRLNTVLGCDVIIVMEAGRVLEMGNPQTLLKNASSYFNNMIRAQTVLSPDASLTNTASV
ncbi:multidrug resistance-associated protein 5-like [Pecten maximus]|uniref:multidrug resistance-associated protein 5-like n=1 Tax=Pecten maximus TaxID=6579 RepID=UPI001457F785|nr:multidrug resistance-associated protein 5-like [Pecten maximus]